MLTRRQKSKSFSILGELLVIFSFALVECSKVDYYTETEWTFVNETNSSIELFSKAYPDKEERHLYLEASSSRTVAYELPVDARVTSITASMAPFSYEGAIVSREGEMYFLPGLFDGIAAENLPSFCNALNYSCHQDGRKLLFSFVLDQASLNTILSYQTVIK